MVISLISLCVSPKTCFVYLRREFILTNNSKAMKKILVCLFLILTGLFCLVAFGASERKAPIKSPI